MGTTISLRRNDHLRVWSSRRTIGVDDEFWNQMLGSFGSQPLVLGGNVKEADARECLDEIFFILFRNDQATRNFSSLIQRVCLLLRSRIFSSHIQQTLALLSPTIPSSVLQQPQHSPLISPSPPLISPLSSSIYSSSPGASSPLSHSPLNSATPNCSPVWLPAVTETLAAPTSTSSSSSSAPTELSPTTLASTIPQDGATLDLNILNGLFFIRLFAREFILYSGNLSQRRLLSHFGASGSDHSRILDLLRTLIASLIIISSSASSSSSSASSSLFDNLRLCNSLLELLLQLLSAGIGINGGEALSPNVFKQHLLNDDELRALAPALVHQLLDNVSTSSSRGNAAEVDRLSSLSLTLLVILFSSESWRTCCYRAALANWSTNSPSTPSLVAHLRNIDNDGKSTANGHTNTRSRNHQALFGQLVTVLASATDNVVSRRPSPTTTASYTADSGSSTSPSSDPLTSAEGTFGLHILFCYYLLYGNEPFRRFVLSRTDIELLIVPLLRYLYVSRLNEVELPLVTTVCTILVLLTRPAPVNRMANETLLPTVPWYSFRYLVDITLLDLMFLIVLKTGLRNLSSAKNPFLQQLCAGVLGNLAKYFLTIHSAVADQIVSTVTLLLPRADKHPLIRSLLDVLLDVLNLFLFFSLSTSTSLVYCLLHKREHFEKFSHPGLTNVFACINHFVSLLGGQTVIDESAGDATTAVLDLIERGLRSWKSSSLSLEGVEPVRFHFTEDDDGDEFFHPFAWSLIIAYSPSSSLLLAVSDASQPLEIP